ncbi:MAG: hypothetical protein DRO09_00180 [Thermoprotei archaeon]|nr:MAG: hypothetical protein DRO09_00180 [Thermoprotei archaeon]
MPELSLTSWLDPILDYFARQAGIPTSDYSAQVGGEGIGVALEVVADLFTKGWLNKVVQFATGAIASGYAIWGGPGVSARLKKELLALGTHELLRFVDPKPSDIIETRKSIDDTVDAIKRGDWNAVLASILRTPSELQAMLSAMGIPTQLTTPPVSPPTAPPASPPAGGSSEFSVNK